MSLIDHLKQIPDFRTQPRYPLWVILLLVIMGTMSGCQGYRALEAFVERHQAALIELLELPYKRLPSFSTLRRIMVRVDFVALAVAFNAWAAETFPPLALDQLATDGKAIKASVIDYDKSYQDFVNLVSAFSVTQGVVVALAPMRNGQTSEIATVQTLLEQLHFSGVCFSLDALHTQKKTLQQIIACGNDYLIALKANQGNLFEAVQLHFGQCQPDSVTTQLEQSHGRQVERTVSVLTPPTEINPAWVGLQRVAKVERRGTRSGKPFEETMFYLSSLPLDAIEFAQRIRDHWQIENRLHWVKDVVLAEDRSPLCDGHALTNFAIIRTIAVNLFRLHGFASITKGIRAVAHNVHQLFSFLQ